MSKRTKNRWQLTAPYLEHRNLLLVGRNRAPNKSENAARVYVWGFKNTKWFFRVQKVNRLGSKLANAYSLCCFLLSPL